MIENEMDYRGSKSITGLNIPQAINRLVIVKEQRVDGSYIEKCTINNKISMLRCTLMGFERNYQVKTLSNQINKVRFSSTLTDINAESTLNP
jgi:hypothetical protein